jgi:uncharacterized protein (UPF0276 family)
VASEDRASQRGSTRRRPSGVGLGLRWEFIDEILEARPDLDFVEVSPENYMGRGGYHDDALERARDIWPVVTHGLTMSLGGTDPLRPDYLTGLRAFLDRVASPWHSDHLCFSTFGGAVLHDLLPIAFQEREVGRIADRIKRAQDAIGRPMAIENISYYVHPGAREMGESEFLARVCDAADCGLMLDVNNAFVNAENHGFDVDAWMATAPLDRVVQIHVAGHDWFEDTGDVTPADVPRTAAEREGKLILDTHGADVCDAVLALLERVLARTGPVPVLLERDQNIPPLDVLLAEVRRLEVIWERAVAARAA